MHQFTIIKEIVIILSVSIPIIFLFRKANIPSIVGFLIAGVIIGPYGFGFITETANIQVMAEVGVILLLFTIGLEVSFSKLMQMRNLVLTVGGAQVTLTIFISAAIFWIFGISFKEAVYLGMLVSLSSTAIVLKLLTDRSELQAPHGRIALGILIFQDLAIVPMFLLLPILGSGDDLSPSGVILQLVFAFGAIAVIIVLAKFLMPKLLFQLAKLRIREAFTVGILLMLLGTAYLTHAIGLSFALGAFIAGLILSESEFSHQIVAEILPLKDSFNSIFFVSVGLLLDISFVIEYPLTLLGLTVGIVFLKSIIIVSLLVILKNSFRIAFLVGLGLAQIGEFSFILAQEGIKYNLLPPAFYNAVLASSIFTMILTPFLFQLTPYLAGKFGKLEPVKMDEVKSSMKNHVIIVGFGLNGKNLARVLRETGIQYVVIELNPDTVKSEKSKGENIIYGDITKEEILHHVNIHEANVIVFAISDPSSSRIGLKLSKQLNSDIYAIVRTRYTTEIDDLMLMGADEVIPEEFETSLQIFGKVLEKYHVPLNVIMKQTQLLRGESYSLMRREEKGAHEFVHLDEILAAGLTDTYYVTEDNPHLNKTIAELDLRAKTETTIIAIVRNGKNIVSPGAQDKLEEGDTIVVTGTHKAVDKAFNYLNGKNVTT